MPSPPYKAVASLIVPSARGAAGPSGKKPKTGVRRRVSREDLLVGAHIRSLRAATGTTQQELSAALGLSRQRLNKYERDRNRISAGHILAISRAPGVSVPHLPGEEGEPRPIEQPTETVILIGDFRSREPRLRRAVRALAGSSSELA